MIKKILSIDGGGIKGVIPAAFLATIEEATGKRIVDHFDLITGTSTGGIIALGLGMGMSAKEVLKFYQKNGPAIFSQENSPGIYGCLKGWVKRKARVARHLAFAKYSPTELENALNEAFGGYKLGQSETRLVIPAFNRQSREVHIFKTAHHERLKLDWKERAVDVALATAAAPTYLPAHMLDNGISLLDGGVWANNPVAVGVVEACSVLGWPNENLRVLSLGCVESMINIEKSTGIAGIALSLSDIFTVGQSSGALGMAKLLCGHAEASPKLYRYAPQVLPGTYSLDSVKQIKDMEGLGATLARNQLNTVREVFMADKKEQFIPLYK